MMSPAKAALKVERATNTALRPVQASQNAKAFPTNQFALPLRPVIAARPAKVESDFSFQARLPVIVGEATYRGLMPVDGLISGLVNGNAGGLNIKQRTRSGASRSVPELDGEIAFKDMVRVNGHIAGRIFSQKGTLIIDESAKVDARVEVGVALISGAVNGDVVAHERVELGPRAVINGNISTPVLTIKPGAIFHGECRMIKNGADNG
jgi:cytoskeletal protein CcmA (bactofilin family)